MGIMVSQSFRWQDCLHHQASILAAQTNSNRYVQNFIDNRSWELSIREVALIFGPFRFLPQQRLLTRAGLALRVGSRALDILAVLVGRAGEVVSKDELIRQVWPSTVVEENNLRVHLTALRKVLGEGHVSGRYIENVPGRGYAFVASVESQICGLATPSDSSAIVPVNNLPGTIGEVIGRDAIIVDVVDQLPHRRLITLTGPGGVGKTTVALAAADRLLGSYADGVAFVDLATISDPTQVLTSTASAVGCVLSAETPSEDLVEFLAVRRLLLILDNCEHVISGCASLASRVLKKTRGVSILATSREPLRTTGEWVQQLAPLALPPRSAASSLQEAIQFPAVRLFIDRASAALSTFAPTDLDTQLIVAICIRLDGLALAIELAAGRMNSMGLRALANSLDASLNVLSNGLRTAVSRHQAVRATVAWSVNLLPLLEERIFRRLGALNGRFSMEAACYVCAEPDIDVQAIEEGILSLINKSLVVADVSGEDVRYRLLETTRVYAQELLAAAGESDQISRRHADYYRALFEAAEGEWQTRPTAEWREAYADQIGNLRSALGWSYSPAGDAHLGAAITVAAIPLWFQLSLVDECLEYVLRALAALDPDSAFDDLQRMKLYAALGWPRMGERAGALGGADAWKMALEIAKKRNDIDFQLRSLWALWVDRTNCGKPREALQLAEEFHVLALHTDEPSDAWIGERMLGAAHHFLGDQNAAKRHIDRMLAFYIEPENRSHAVRFQFDQRVTARVALARVLWLQGFTQRALDEIRETIDYALSIDHKLSLANVLAEAACPVALLCGDIELADQYIAMLHAQTSAQALNVWNTYADCFRGESLIARGALAPGLSALQSGLGRLRRSGFRLFESALLAAMTRACLRSGLVAEGAAYVSEALALCGSTGEGWCLPELLRLQADVFLLTDPTDTGTRSEPIFLHSIQLAREQGAMAWKVRTAASCAKLYIRQGRETAAYSILSNVLKSFEGDTGSRDVAEASSILQKLAI
jgi:predicted ATPase/DNA-binding winged helix-turn-helix (wHTH) protein